ncbi:hypothetical protein CONPUDRAFT_146067 [Coniophora puteana RWD-64-598 SS2]|uniref:Glycosyl transferase family 25 domain-containing protein n=1 Tax=Coniophora puteana (strain RWD-64-598) TaxID=741705 RepID=A0A5M3MFK2_CONPW|nr:uncharacterized protein CONPUDRAFT_146067 [Coniophora puteana RWD-64-598 SS2]EIW77992.1 hypothetical protein CONPUDRAFT_146067 [Coniophora puteana RWD-64-598 SS2]
MALLSALSSLSPRMTTFLLGGFVLCLLIFSIPPGSMSDSATDWSPPNRFSSQKTSPGQASFRDKLAHVLPSDRLPHARTLLPLPSEGDTGEIYAISLARRTDRRHILSQIADALDLDFTFIDATDASLPMIDVLMDRVGWQRWERVDEQPAPADEYKPADYSEDARKGMVYHAFRFEWSGEVQEALQLGANETGDMPPMYLGADYWDGLAPGAEEWARERPTKPLPEAGPTWKTSLTEASVLNNLRMTEMTRRAGIACWHSHYQAIRDMVYKDHAVGLILEDDIDIEFDIEKTLLSQWSHLPSDWDILFLGHCHSEEWRNPPILGAPRFRKTYHALCLHGYALSRKGARKLLTMLRSADYAYSRPIDHGVKDLVQMHHLVGYSAYPPLIVQRKEDTSDIVGDLPADFAKSWKAKEGDLADSTLERVRAYEKGQS